MARIAVIAVLFRDITLNGRYIPPDQRYCRVQVRLPTPGDKNVGRFFDEPLCRSQADPAIAPGDYSYLSFKRAHFLLLRWTVVRNNTEQSLQM
jgi:hypothetical protein